MNQSTPTQSPAKPPASSAASLSEYLSERDQPCPSCGHNLRGVTEDSCPKCGMALTTASLQASRGPSTSPPILAVRVLSVIAFCVAGYLAFTGLTNSQPAGCAPGAGCGEVLSSPWSSLWGVPVSVPGVLVYFGLFLCTFHVSARQPDARRRDAWTVMYALAIFAGLAAIWYTYLQFFVIKSICPYCMIDHTCGMLIAALVLYSAPVKQGETLAQGQRSPLVLGQGRAISIAVSCVMIMGLFILTQFAFPASTHREVVTGPLIIPDELPATTGTVKDGKAVTATNGKPAPPVRSTDPDQLTLLPGTEKDVWLRVAKGQLKFERTQLPVRGNINARIMLVCMVDYTCPHCRLFHHLFPKAVARYGDQVAFMIVPMPLNPDCNPYVRYREERHEPACDLARLSLAVWRTDASKFAQFDDWLFEPEKARTGREARAKAEELVGKDELQKMFDTGWPHEQALKHVRVYDMANQGRIPKVMFQNLAIEGGIQEEDFWKWLEETEGIKLQRK